MNKFLVFAIAVVSFAAGFALGILSVCGKCCDCDDCGDCGDWCNEE